jgi:hypothetical protein
MDDETANPIFDKRARIAKDHGCTVDQVNAALD